MAYLHTREIRVWFPLYIIPLSLALFPGKTKKSRTFIKNRQIEYCFLKGYSWICFFLSCQGRPTGNRMREGNDIKQMDLSLNRTRIAWVCSMYSSGWTSKVFQYFVFVFVWPGSQLTWFDFEAFCSSIVLKYIIEFIHLFSLCLPSSIPPSFTPSLPSSLLFLPSWLSWQYPDGSTNYAPITAT